MAAQLGAAGIEVDALLGALQSSDNASRSAAEARLAELTTAAGPALVFALLAQTHGGPSLSSRQLAGTLLAWRLPAVWRALPPEGRASLQSALIEAFSRCEEPPVLRALGECVNTLSQTVATVNDVLWEAPLHVISDAICGTSAAQRKAAIGLLESLVDSMGARLRPFYPGMGRKLAELARGNDPDVAAAAFAAAAALVSSWCAGPEDLEHWLCCGEAIVTVGASELDGRGAVNGWRLLSSALRAARKLFPLLQSPAATLTASELACRVLSAPAKGPSEHCRIQSLELLAAFARRSAQLLPEATLNVIIACVCNAARDCIPSVDDLDEVDGIALAARDCLRVFARALPAVALREVYGFATTASQSRDAMDRSAAVHAVAFALSGAREAPPDWAWPFANALTDPTVWVRQAAAEGAAMLARALRQGPEATKGLLLLAEALAQQLPAEPSPELVAKRADAIAAILGELSTEESVAVLPAVVPPLLAALTAATHAGADGAIAAEAAAVEAAAAVAFDHFGPYAIEASAALLVPLRSIATSGSRGGAAPAACLTAAGAVAATSWELPEFAGTRDELFRLALAVLAAGEAAGELRASAHGFFARVALLSGEGFAPQLAQVVPSALSLLNATDGSELPVGKTEARGVRTGCTDERRVAIEALGSYAVGTGRHFAEYMPAVLPALAAQRNFAGSEIRAAAARALGQLGLALGTIAGAAEVAGEQGAGNRAAAAALGLALVSELRAFRDQGGNGPVALAAAQSAEDLLREGRFLLIVGPEASAALAACAENAPEASECSDASDGDDE